jgi:outer membrane protein OmpA-like peptidoglycan-associated protein
VRRWTPNVSDDPPTALLLGAPWRLRATAPAEAGFVFELPAVSTIDRFGFTQIAPAARQPSLRIAVSTDGPDRGFTDVATIAAHTPAGTEQTVTPDNPPAARWLKVTIDGGAGTGLSSLAAYGDPPASVPQHAFAGHWLIDDHVRALTDPSFGSSGAFAPQNDFAKHSDALLEIVQHDDGVQGALCWSGNADYVWRGTRSSNVVTYLRPTNTSDTPHHLTMNAEGTMLVGDENQPRFTPFVAIKISDGTSCLSKPVGSGKDVVVLTKSASTYAPMTLPKAYPGYRFRAVLAPALAPHDLDSADTAVLAAVCDAKAEFADWQSAELLAFVARGHKLIVTEADSCHDGDYSFLPYAFTGSYPGAGGRRGTQLLIVEPSTLGSGRSDPRHFVDVQAYVANVLQQLGDADIAETHDPHWCGHLFGVNALHRSGFFHMYARYERGLIIFNGLDVDDGGLPEYQRIARFELAQPVGATLPCSQTVAGGFIVAPSSTQRVAGGRAQTVRFPLRVLASLGWSGTIALTIAPESNVHWNASLSDGAVSLHGGDGPLTATIAVPADAPAGASSFEVRGTSADGSSAHAELRVEIGKPSAIAQQLARTGRADVYGIHFDFNRAAIRPESTRVLDEIAGILRAHTRWNLAIQGHTDDVGTAAYNLDLSRRRAAAVKSALVNHYHIAASRLRTRGYGATRPKASNATDAGRALNRRVELVRV